MPTPSRAEFLQQVERLRAAHPGDAVIVPVCTRLLADQLTPVVAYRRLVAPDERAAPSFLLESVEGGERQGRYSLVGAQPAIEVIARGDTSEVVLHVPRCQWLALKARQERDPLAALRAFTQRLHVGEAPGLPGCFLGGLVGYAAYDSVRYAEPGKLSFAAAPPDDRALPDLHFGFYDNVVVFDHAAKLVVLVHLAAVPPGADPAPAYDAALQVLRERAAALEKHTEPLRSGEVPTEIDPVTPTSNMTRDEHANMLAKAKEYIRAGDIFQVVLGQRFERVSPADPFDVYRALRTVNPSPYMAYIQASGCILIASSPEILCRVRRDASSGGAAHMVVTNRPLAGTRRRGKTREEDLALERELLADAKERAEHVMLVDLGRNDVGRVASPGSIALPGVMEIERYSHVMHISSTVTGRLREGLDCWDALRAALPVGTISGAPKIRAMQIIDELEPVRRGPYGGGLGYVGVDGQMDIALALRTIVVPLDARRDGRWTYHMQASGGIVADSVTQDEYQETVNKAAAMNRAVGVAERAFGA
ncbi:MAG: anthranilate synthase component I [Tepidisphaera sp.]|nr:anthranilate synthase component I [Tepidisphaera sp.]